MSATKAFEQFLNTVVRVRISDGRLIEGQLQCMDSDKNFILASSIEYHGVEDDTLSPIGKEYIARHLGMAMIPGKHVVKVLAMIPDAV